MVWRFIRLVGVFLFAGLEHFIRRGKRWTPVQRADWLQRSSARLLRSIGFRVEWSGPLPEGGSFIVPNHLGYMDIIVLGSILPQVFLSKSEVADWPIVGSFTRMAGTLFIDRKRRSDVANKEVVFSEVLEAGLNLTFFLEGTSSDGRVVLPFRSSLLEPVVANQWAVAPAFIRYQCEGGTVETDVCWWGDMGFAEHLVRMLRVKKVLATVVFGERRQASCEDRKVLAQELHQEVVKLSGSLAQPR